MAGALWKRLFHPAKNSGDARSTANRICTDRAHAWRGRRCLHFCNRWASLHDVFATKISFLPTFFAVSPSRTAGGRKIGAAVDSLGHAPGVVILISNCRGRDRARKQSLCLRGRVWGWGGMVDDTFRNSLPTLFALRRCRSQNSIHYHPDCLSLCRP